jgi:hypothetical protein
MIHELKISPVFFEDVLAGKKTFELRQNDRPYHAGDLLALNEYDANSKRYTGASCVVYVDYILADEQYCKDGYVAMSIKPCFVEQVTEPYDHAHMRTSYKVHLATKRAEKGYVE